MPRPRHLLVIAVALGTAAGFVVVARQMGASVVEAATTPSWGYLVGAFAAWIVIQPLRALLWKLTMRQPVEFRAIYAASAVGSFLDTIVPGRLGEVSKLGLLRVAAGPSWPGLPTAGGSLLCKHLLDGIAFALVGAAAAFFLPIPMWGRVTLIAVAVLAAAAMAASGSLHRRVGHRLPV
ncbi:MAG: flippase-like domain-containing protein, partial [Thermoleophilia bacterium]|nr:flippase-like domain-containing protein [Thermoleophilia bacterium]